MRTNKAQLYQTKADIALGLLRESIKKGEFRPGDPLPQRVLARRFGMSLTPVREAVRALEAEGLLAGASHKTLRVKDVTAEDVREIYAVRAVLEEFATTVAVPRLTPADIRQFEDLVEKMAAVAQRGQSRRYRTLDEQFHMSLYLKAGNTLLRGLIVDLWSRYPRDVLWTVPGRLRESLAEHRRILRAMKAADATRAGSLLRAHILNSMDGVVALLERQAASGSSLSTADGVREATDTDGRSMPTLPEACV